MTNYQTTRLMNKHHWVNIPTVGFAFMAKTSTGNKQANKQIFEVSIKPLPSSCLLPNHLLLQPKTNLTKPSLALTAKRCLLLGRKV